MLWAHLEWTAARSATVVEGNRVTRLRGRAFAQPGRRAQTAPKTAQTEPLASGVRNSASAKMEPPATPLLVLALVTSV